MKENEKVIITNKLICGEILVNCEFLSIAYVFQEAINETNCVFFSIFIYTFLNHLKALISNKIIILYRKIID